MSLRNIFRSPRLAGRNLRYIIFHKKRNLVLRKSPLWEHRGKKETPSTMLQQVRPYCTPGSGAGRGGGSGGSIREAGGVLGKFGAVNEEGYFYDKQKEQLEKLKDEMKRQDKPQKGTKEEREMPKE